jgi:redox-sensitive bicupin YhaK (pirin superfamily)
MIKLIRSADRYNKDAGWLNATWHFSFGDYHDASNMRWGALRVFNDDWIEPASGFPRHPHDNMEIITYVIEGELTHEDSLGNKGTIKAGEVQCMTAGTGINHAEYNASPDQKVHLMQMWLMPKVRNLPPSWGQKQFTQEQRQGRLLPIVSGKPIDGMLQINQEATFYVSALHAGDVVEHTNTDANHKYLFIIKGEVELNGQTLHSGDQARMSEEPRLMIKATQETELVLWDLV